MIKPKYPKRADVSQMARLTVECATGEALTLPPRKKMPNKKNKGTRAGKNGD
jgi:hypothetical protein